jgi:hypothetical protein
VALLFVGICFAGHDLPAQLGMTKLTASLEWFLAALSIVLVLSFCLYRWRRQTTATVCQTRSRRPQFGAEGPSESVR